MKYALTEYFAPVLSTAEDGTALTWGDAQADEVRVFNTLAELQREIDLYLVNNDAYDLLGNVIQYTTGMSEVFVGFQVNLVADDDTELITEDAYA